MHIYMYRPAHGPFTRARACATYLLSLPMRSQGGTGPGSLDAWVRACRGEVNYFVGAGALEGLKVSTLVVLTWLGYSTPV